MASKSFQTQFTNDQLWAEYHNNAKHYSYDEGEWTGEPSRSYFELKTTRVRLTLELIRRAQRNALYAEFSAYLSQRPKLGFRQACEEFLNEEGRLPIDREVVLKAAARNPSLLKFCDSSFLSDPEILLVAALNNSFRAALCYLSNEYDFIPRNVADGDCYDYETIEPLRKLKILVERDLLANYQALFTHQKTELETLKRILSSRGIEVYTIIFDWCIEAEGKYYLVVDELNDEETNQRHEILRVYIENKKLESQVAVSALSPSRELLKI